MSGSKQRSKAEQSRSSSLLERALSAAKEDGLELDGPAFDEVDALCDVWPEHQSQLDELGDDLEAAASQQKSIREGLGQSLRQDPGQGHDSDDVLAMALSGVGAVAVMAGVVLVLVLVGMVVVWPLVHGIVGDQQRPVPIVLGVGVEKQAGLKIDLNKADVGQVTLLPGIGPTLAKRIVDDREALGAFDGVEQVTRVKGIGPKRLEQIQDFVVADAGGD